MSKKATIKITSDTKDAESGLDKVSKKINEFSKNNQQSLGGVQRFNNAIKGAVKSFSSIGVAAGAAVGAIKKINDVVSETTNLYKEQIKAERQLETAAKNNPYLDETSVDQLKDFASAMQKVSNVGDEELIPMMAELAAAGRTQDEIQNIMSAALDVSASGMMSLDSAVSALNKTFSGTAGQLGNQIAGLKDLTKEELATGKAVDIVADKFKGMAAATVDTAAQLKNMKGDFKEAIGEFTLPSSDLWNRFWTGFYEKGTEIINKFNDYLDRTIIGQGIAEKLVDGMKQIKDQRQQTLYLEDNIHDLSEAQLKSLTSYLENLKRRNKEQDRLLEKAKMEAESRAYLAKIYKEMDEDAAAQQKAAEEEAAAANTLLEKREKLRTQYDETLRKTQAEIENRRKLGEEINEETEAQIMLNAATQAYINMYSDAAFNRALTKTGVWEGEEAQLKQIENWAEMVHKEEELAGQEEEDIWAHEKEIVEAWQTQEQETLELQRTLLQSYLDYLNTKEKLTDEEIAQQQKVADAIKKIDAEIAANKKKSVAETISVITDYIEQFASISKDITALARQNNEQERNEELTELSKQYTDGLISYEDYCEKKKQIERKAAQEEYKVKMWEWNVSILQATANIAEGISKAIAQGGIAGIITGALVAAAGAVQIASITASRPKPPSFAQGGIVPGKSYSGDRVQANVNSGEMILNAQQQRALWEAANGGGRGGATVNMPVTIENTASDKVSASAQMSPKGLQIIIRDIVRAQMENGDYSQSMAVGNNKNSGISYF
jgi:hypothetical protein